MTKLAQKRDFLSKTEKLNITIKFLVINLAFVTDLTRSFKAFLKHRNTYFILINQIFVSLSIYK